MTEKQEAIAADALKMKNGLNMAKEYFLKEISYNKDDECKEDVFAAKKENNYMFLTTPKFKFLDFKNYIGPGLSYDAWCKLMGCRLQKLIFLDEWLDSYEKKVMQAQIGTVVLNLQLQGIHTSSF